jgi:hypothetical protein
MDLRGRSYHFLTKQLYCGWSFRKIVKSIPYSKVKTKMQLSCHNFFYIVLRRISKLMQESFPMKDLDL